MEARAAREKVMFSFLFYLWASAFLLGLRLTIYSSLFHKDLEMNLEHIDQLLKSNTPFSYGKKKTGV